MWRRGRAGAPRERRRRSAPCRPASAPAPRLSARISCRISSSTIVIDPAKTISCAKGTSSRPTRQRQRDEGAAADEIPRVHLCRRAGPLVEDARCLGRGARACDGAAALPRGQHDTRDRNGGHDHGDRHRCAHRSRPWPPAAASSTPAKTVMLIADDDQRAADQRDPAQRLHRGVQRARCRPRPAARPLRRPSAPPRPTSRRPPRPEGPDRRA